MSFRHTLSDILSRKSQGSSSKAAPPVPLSSKPPPLPVRSLPPPLPTREKMSTKLPVPYWQPTLSSSVPVSQHFSYEVGAHGWGNNELQNYVDHPSNSFHSPSGQLVVRAIADSTLVGDKYTSARLSSHQTLSRRRGCLTVKLTAPSAAGIWPACWLLPAEPFAWPADGEVDIFESWNGDRVNHSCLHWGYHTSADWNKHRVRDTVMADIAAPAGHVYQFVWDQPAQGEGGRMLWYIDGKAVMKAQRPSGTRPMEDWRIILNIAVGGNVCAGQVPHDGVYDFVIHELRLCDQPDDGWESFERDWVRAKEGNANVR